MEIVRSKFGGFCSGVRHAVDTAFNLPPDNLYILGELIHNKFINDKLEARGVKTVDGIDEVKSGTVIIRSHGVGEETFKQAESKGLKIIDCTCKYVKKIQNIVKEYHLKGYKIVIFGEAKHPEVLGLSGWCNKEAVVIDKNYDLSTLNQFDKICVVAQTTALKEDFDKILKNIEKVYKKTVVIFNTICYTTIGRQSEADRLSKECDAVVVLGGGNSSNTKKLYDICLSNCKNVFFVKSAQELDCNVLTKFNKIAVVSGASTPYEQTQEVFLKMEKTEAADIKLNEMEQVVAELDEGKKTFKMGQIIEATISSADDDGLAVLLPLNKKETLLPKEEIDCEVYDKNDYADKLGSTIEIMVKGFNPLAISQKAIRKIKEEEALLADIENGKEFSVTIETFNKGGLTSKFAGCPVFIPANSIRIGYVKDLEKYVGKTLRVKAIQIKKEKRKEIIASQRVVLEAEKEEKDKIRAEKEGLFFESISVGDVVEGKVERFSNFGAFVSVKGFDCLAHISDLSWTNIQSPADVLELGKVYEFKVLKINKEAKKVSIGYKQLQPEPWDLAAEKYQAGDIVTGTVVRIAPFGAFVEIEKGIDALVRVSEISYEWVEDPTVFLAIGQTVDAKITAMDAANRKMTLSIKALLTPPEVVKTEKKKEKEVSLDEAKSDDRPKKARKPRADRAFTENKDELREWNEGGQGGASIAEMLNQK